MFQVINEKRLDRYHRRMDRRLRRRNKRKSYNRLHFARLDNIRARNHLLSNSSCYYEFPILELKEPPSNSYIDYCLVHAFQRGGFQSAIAGNYHQIMHHTDSKREIPFEGVIRGKEFKHIKKVPIFVWILTGITILGLIIPWIITVKRKKKFPIMATIAYWGLNLYPFHDISSIIGLKDNFTGELEFNEMRSTMKYANKYHPESTILHVALAFEVKPKHFKSQEEIEGKFNTIKSIIEQELGTFPLGYENKTPSQEIVTKHIFKWTKKRLRNVEQRFPLNR